MADVPDGYVQRRSRPWWFKLLVICLVLLAAGLLYDAFGRSDWNRALAEARADGKPVTLAGIEAARKVWPDHANGARIILDLADRLSAIAKEAEKENLPIIGGHQSKKPAFPLGQRWDGATDQAVARRLQEWAPVLSQVNRLRDLEGGRFPLEIKPCPIDILLPSLSPLRQSARLKSLDVTWRAMHGRTDTLPEDVAILLHHGQIVADDPFIISALVRVAIDSLTISTIENVCAQGVVPPDKLIAVERLLAAAENPDYLSSALRGERATFIGTADWYRAHGEPASEGLPRIPTWLPGVHGYLYRDQAVGVRMYNRIVAVADKPTQAIAVADAWEGELKGMRFLSFTRWIMPSLKRACEFATRATAQVRCARVALATERYRIDTGSFPAKLEDLVPKYLDRVPVDPFDGQPLRYRLTPEQTCVYSVGWDLKDNGGIVDPSLPNTKEQDLGFRLLPPEKRGLAPSLATASTQTAPSPP